jgi:hypothetical protein
MRVTDHSLTFADLLRFHLARYRVIRLRVRRAVAR